MDLCKIRNEISKGESIYNIPLRVTFYARVSTDKDVQLNSLDNQILYFENFIKDNRNWTYVNGYVDEGISGTSVKNRTNFLKMIKDAKDGYFDLILTKEISRFSRNTVDSIKYTQELLENDVGVLFLSDNINTILPDSELRLTIMSSIAQEEVRKLSERVRFGMKRSKEKGVVLGNNAITGYTKNKGKLEINEKEAILIRKIYSMYASGEYGLAKISKKLYNEGYKTKKGDFIHITTLRRIITNPKYKGFYCTNTVMTKDYKNKKQIRLPMEEWIIKESNGEIPAIVSEELWDKANEILKSRKTNYLKNIEETRVFMKKYSYSGIIYCKHHNKKYKRIANNGKSYWICNEYVTHGLKECKSIRLYESELDKIFKYIYNDLINNFDDIMNNLFNVYKNINCSTDNEIKRLKKEINNLDLKKESLLELYIDKIITKDEFENRNKKYNNEILYLTNEAKKLENNDIFAVISGIKKINVNDFINDNFDKLSKLLINKIVVENIPCNEKKVVLDIYINILNIKYIWDYNNFTYNKQLCSHNENNDCTCCNRKCTSGFGFACR